MRGILGALAALTAALTCAVGSAAAQVVTTTFDDGTNDGWTGTGLASQYTPMSSGGNPISGGYLQFIDMEGNTNGTITAPATYINALPQDNGGRLTWDSKVFSESTSGPDGTLESFLATIVGGTHSSTATFTTTIQDMVVGTWVNTVAPLDAADWSITGSDSWANIIANPTSLSIEIERVANSYAATTSMPGDTDGIDNVILSPVPEPSSLILAGVGVTFGTWRCRGRRVRTWRWPARSTST